MDTNLGKAQQLEGRHMKRCLLSFLLGILMMLPMATVYAQPLPCSPNEVTAGFVQAIQSGTLEMWATSYAQSDCPGHIKNGASAMAAAYIAMNATVLPFASPSDPSALNPIFAWQPGGAVGNAYDLTLYPGEFALTAGARSHDAPPMLIYPFQGDFQVSVRVDFQTDGPSDQAAGIGLRAAQDHSEGDWASILSYFTYFGSEIWSGLFYNGGEFGRVDYENSVVYLRLIKRGTLVSTEYSTDGANWVILVNNRVHSLPDNVEIFLYAFSSNEEGVLARFSEFSIVAR
jgi:regulation of enolase protein 1 (concanavalin A-like superfamily)